MSLRFITGVVLGVVLNASIAAIICTKHEIMTTQAQWIYMLDIFEYWVWTSFFSLAAIVALVGIVAQRQIIVRVGTGIGFAWLIMLTMALALVPVDSGPAITGLVPLLVFGIALFELIFIGVPARDWFDTPITGRYRFRTKGS